MKRILIALVLAVLLVPAPTFQTGQAFAAFLSEERELLDAPKVEIFVTGWCPYCRKLESFLTKSHINFKRYDIEKDTKAAQLFSRLGGNGVPMARVGSKVIHGYDPQAILTALKDLD